MTSATTDGVGCLGARVKWHGPVMMIGGGCQVFQGHGLERSYGC